MKHKQSIAIILSCIVFLSFLSASLIVFFYLTEYGSRRLALASAITFGGIILSCVVYWIFTKLCHNRKCEFIFVAVFCIIILTPFLSMKCPGKITYSRFGLTVYGCIPIPILDITVGPKGVLGFRDKSHFITLQEVEALLIPEVEIVVIGIGWNDVVKVDEAIRNIEKVKVEILSTPQAYETYNQYKSEGKKVVLIAHSTC